MPDCAGAGSFHSTAQPEPATSTACGSASSSQPTLADIAGTDKAPGKGLTNSAESPAWALAGSSNPADDPAEAAAGETDQTGAPAQEPQIPPASTAPAAKARRNEASGAAEGLIDKSSRKRRLVPDPRPGAQRTTASPFGSERGDASPAAGRTSTQPVDLPDPNQKPMDPRLRPFLTTAPSLLVSALPPEAQEFLSGSAVAIAQHLRELKQARAMMDWVDPELYAATAQIKQVISSVIATDQCIQDDARHHAETEKTCPRTATLQHTQLVLDSVGRNAHVPTKALAKPIQHISDEVKEASEAAQSALRVLPALRHR